MNIPPGDRTDEKTNFHRPIDRCKELFFRPNMELGLSLTTQIIHELKLTRKVIIFTASVTAVHDHYVKFMRLFRAR